MNKLIRPRELIVWHSPTKDIWLVYNTQKNWWKFRGTHAEGWPIARLNIIRVALALWLYPDDK